MEVDDSNETEYGFLPAKSPEHVMEENNQVDEGLSEFRDLTLNKDSGSSSDKQKIPSITIYYSSPTSSSSGSKLKRSNSSPNLAPSKKIRIIADVILIIIVFCLNFLKSYL